MQIILDADEIKTVMTDYIQSNYCSGEEKAVITNDWNVFTLEFQIVKEKDSEDDRAEEMDSAMDSSS